MALVKLPRAAWRTRPGLAALIDALGGAEQTRFVGGAIRDTLLGLPASDVDLATRLQPTHVVERLRAAGIKAIPTGIAHGTVTAVSAGTPVEVTTLRRDVATNGRHATVAFTDDWMEDAARRDFTINALYADPASGVVQDYFGGVADLERRLVRFIGDPLTRIAEDHLRILRFFRFHARFGSGMPDADGLEACVVRANDLMALSRERIADELLKLLSLPDPLATVRLMVEHGVLRPVLPEIEADGLDRLGSLIAREKAAAIPPAPLRRLAALLPPDPELAASIAARLRLSNKAAKRLVTSADRRREDPEQPLALAYQVGGDEAVDRLLLGEGDTGLVGQLVGWSRPRFALGGGDLIAMGLAPGPLVARTLQKIERAWIDGGFGADREAIRELARAEVDRALRSGN
jgi:poly(A) polymerase